MSIDFRGRKWSREPIRSHQHHVPLFLWASLPRLCFKFLISVIYLHLISASVHVAAGAPHWSCAARMKLCNYYWLIFRTVYLYLPIAFYLLFYLAVFFCTSFFMFSLSSFSCFVLTFLTLIFSKSSSNSSKSRSST